HPLNLRLVQLHLARRIAARDQAGSAGALVADVGVAEPELAAGPALVRQHVILIVSFHFDLVRLWYGNLPPGSAALNSRATEAGGHERVALARSFGFEQ